MSLNENFDVKEFCTRSLKATSELRKLADMYLKSGNIQEYWRIQGKIEGIDLVFGYFNEEYNKQ